MAKHEYSNWLSDEDYKKIMTTARGQVNGILNLFNCYGQEREIRIAKHLLMQVIENSMAAVRGKKVQIQVIFRPLPNAMGREWDVTDVQPD